MEGTYARRAGGLDVSAFKPDGHWIDAPPAAGMSLDPERIIGGKLYQLRHDAMEADPTGFPVRSARCLDHVALDLKGLRGRRSLRAAG